MRLVILVAGAGIVVAGLALWRATRDGATASAPSSAPPAGAPPAASLPEIRDVRLDRDMTGSQEAFDVYEEGRRLFDTLPVQAAARFRRAAFLDPGFAPAQYRLAVASIVNSRQADARAAIQAAARSQDRLPEPYRSGLTVMTHFIDGSFDLADATMREALARQPADADLRYLAGTMNSQVCDYFDPNGIIENFEKVLAVEPDYPGARTALMEGYEMKGMLDWVLSRAQQSRSRDPRPAGSAAELGRARIARLEYGDAIEAADELLRRGEDVLGSGLAPAFILTGHFDQLTAMYDPEMERTNSMEANVTTHLHAGINDVWQGRWQSAISHFERGPEFLPAPWEKSMRARFLALLGRVESLVGRTTEADKAFEAGQTSAGPQPVLEYMLGLNMLKAGRLTDAQRAVHRLSQESRPSLPGWNEPWRLLLAGEVALAAGDAPRALDSFREAWRLEEPLALDCIVGHPEAYFLEALGRGYLEARRPQDALQAFERIRALGPRGLHQPEVAILAHFYSARALEALERQPEAAARYGQFLKLWGGSEPAPAEVEEARARLVHLGGGAARR